MQIGGGLVRDFWGEITDGGEGGTDSFGESGDRGGLTTVICI